MGAIIQKGNTTADHRSLLNTLLIELCEHVSLYRKLSYHQHRHCARKLRRHRLDSGERLWRSIQYTQRESVIYRICPTKAKEQVPSVSEKV